MRALPSCRVIGNAPRPERMANHLSVRLRASVPDQRLTPQEPRLRKKVVARGSLPSLRFAMTAFEVARRKFMLAAAAGFAVTGNAAAQSRTDEGPRTLDGQPMPEPGPEKSAGPVRPGRGSSLTG